jgi:hypothetical protein
MNVAMPQWSIGELIALLVLVVCLVLWLMGGPPDDRTLALIAALAVARLT